MYMKLAKTVRGAGRRWSSASGVSLIALGLLVGTLYAGAPADPAAAAAAGEGAVADAAMPSSVDLDQLEERIQLLSNGWAGLDEYYRAEVVPIKRVLRRYGADTPLAEQIAVALVREANAAQLEPRLLLAVLLVENPWLDPKIRSPVGAVGLMQVMPFHRGHWAPCAPDLEDIDANICHGARIFAHYFEATNGNIDRALLRYNGCVHGTNTPDCHQYPYHVFARAGRASIQAWVDGARLTGGP